MKSIVYINKTDKTKSVKVKSIAVLNKIKIDSFAESEVAALPEDAEILIIRGMSRSNLEKFLNDLRKKGIKIDLKCVETEVNRDWSLQRLYEEIKKEHDALE